MIYKIKILFEVILEGLKGLKMSFFLQEKIVMVIYPKPLVSGLLFGV